MEPDWSRGDILSLLQLLTMIVLPPFTAVLIFTYQIILRKAYDSIPASAGKS